MNLNDIIALAKSGYKKKDIDELLALDVTPEIPDEPAQENGQKDDAEVQQAEDNDPIDDTIQKQIEEAQSEIRKLKDDLAAAQKLNRTYDITRGLDELEERRKRIEELARKMM